MACSTWDHHFHYRVLHHRFGLYARSPFLRAVHPGHSAVVPSDPSRTAVFRRSWRAFDLHVSGGRRRSSIYGSGDRFHSIFAPHVCPCKRRRATWEAYVHDIEQMASTVLGCLVIRTSGLCHFMRIYRFNGGGKNFLKYNQTEKAENVIATSVQCHLELRGRICYAELHAAHHYSRGMALIVRSQYFDDSPRI